MVTWIILASLAVMVVLTMGAEAIVGLTGSGLSAQYKVEAVDYLRAVAPRHAVPIHQGIIAPEARGIFYGRLDEMTDTDFRVLNEESAFRF